MALSGSMRSNIGDHWYLQLEWTGSQSITGNYTDVTARLYFGGDQYGDTHTSATKTAAIQFDNGTWHTHSEAGLANIADNQKKLIYSYTQRIGHNDDGTGSFGLQGYFELELTLSGHYYGTVYTDQKTYTLDRIPRKSTLKNDPNWTAGNNLYLSVNRASTSFSHKAYIDMKDSSGNWQNIKSIDFGASASSSFSVAENTDIFNWLNTNGSAQTRVNLHTYSGGTDLGVNTYYGTVTAPDASYATVSNGIGISEASGQGGQTVYVDQDIKIDIHRYNSAFYHTVKFLDSNNGSVLHTATNVGTSYTWSPTQAEMNTMYQRKTDGIEFDGDIKVDTYYNGEKVRDERGADINYRIRNAEPIFDDSAIDYHDSNPDAVAITGNDHYIVQNVSNIIAEINAQATAQKYATIKSYVVSVGGAEKSVSASATSADLGKINAGNNQTLSVKAVDSRGLTTTVYKTVNMIPYKAPNLTAKAKRNNDFEDTTIVNGFGSYSPLTVDGVNKNTIQSLEYRYKPKDSGTFTNWVDLNFSLLNNVFNGDGIAVILANTQSWTVEVKVADILSEITQGVTVDTGQPILFIDPIKKSIGFGDFPTGLKEFLINGHIRFGSTQWAGSTEEGLGAIFLNNGDMTGVNGIWFNDKADNDGEGLHYLKTGRPIGSNDIGDYDTLRMLDGTLYCNSVPFAMGGLEVLWTGAKYMQNGQTVQPSKKLSQCAKGWILVWSDYDPDTNTSYDVNFVYTFIPKWHAYNFPGDGIFFTIQANVGRDALTSKYLYVDDINITGHAENNDPTGNPWSDDVVLRNVLAW